jgi:hypothetical protein
MIEKYQQTSLKCPNKGCVEETNLYDFKRHVDNCAFKNVKDEKDFSRLITNEKEDHMEENRLVEFLKKIYGLDEILVLKQDSNLGDSRMNNSKLMNSKISQKSMKKNVNQSMTGNVARMSIKSSLRRKSTNIQNPVDEFKILNEIGNNFS